MANLYKDGATFRQVMMLYRFDKKLRLLIFNEIEKIEIAIRRAVMQIPAVFRKDGKWNLYGNNATINPLYYHFRV